MTSMLSDGFFRNIGIELSFACANHPCFDVSIGRETRKQMLLETDLLVSSNGIKHLRIRPKQYGEVPANSFAGTLF